MVIHGDMYSPHQRMFFWCLGHLKVWLRGAVPQVGFLHHLVIPLYKACAVVWLTVIRGFNWLFLLSKSLASVGSDHVHCFSILTPLLRFTGVLSTRFVLHWGFLVFLSTSPKHISIRLTEAHWRFIPYFGGCKPFPLIIKTQNQINIPSETSISSRISLFGVPDGIVRVSRWFEYRVPTGRKLWKLWNSAGKLIKWLHYLPSGYD